MSAAIIPHIQNIQAKHPIGGYGVEETLKNLYFYPNQISTLLQKHGFNPVFSGSGREEKGLEYIYTLISYLKNSLKRGNSKGMEAALTALKMGDTSVLAKKINDAVSRKDVIFCDYLSKNESEEEDVLEQLDTQNAEKMGVLKEKAKISLMLKSGEISAQPLAAGRGVQLIWEC